MFVVVDGIRLLWGAQARSIPTPLVDTSVDVAGVSLNGQLLLGVGVAALLIGLVFLLLNHTWLGLRIRALAQDETAARLMGMRITWSRHATWAIAGALTGAAGSVIVPAFALQPSAGDSIGLTAFAVVILGGLGSLWGAVIASLTLGVLESLTEGYIGSGLDEIVAFTALVAMLLVRPQGLAGRAA
jgi:branched-chain amino acid transport system permease protein